MDEDVRIIYVDLDHTLVRIDLLRERLLIAILRNPSIFLRRSFGSFREDGRGSRSKSPVASALYLYG